LAAAFLLACVYYFRAPALRGFAGLLVVDEPPPDADALLVLDGDRCFEQAARLYHAGGAGRVLLNEHRPGRLQQMGILPSFTELARRQLTAARVPGQALEVLPGETRSNWDRARLLRDWLCQHPGARVTVLCDRFGSRQRRCILDRVLDPEEAARVRVYALPHRSYRETDWWRSKQGILDLFDAYVVLTFTWLVGEDKDEWREWDPEAYERALR
jgi:hypothetical protein